MHEQGTLGQFPAMGRALTAGGPLRSGCEGNGWLDRGLAVQGQQGCKQQAMTLAMTRNILCKLTDVGWAIR